MPGIPEIKQELLTLNARELAELCLRLARYKKENKELLAYQLFESHDRESYTTRVKEEIEESFIGVNKTNLYLAKKTLRKILRDANKYIKYTANKETEAEVLMFYLQQLKDSGINLRKNKAITNLYLQQLKKIRIAIAALHEDVQYDLSRHLEELEM